MISSEKLRIPRSLPMLYEPKAKGYRHPEEATAGEWRAAKASSRKAELAGAVIPGTYARTVRLMVKIADALGLPDRVRLVPHLQALAAADVTSIRAKGGAA